MKDFNKTMLRVTMDDGSKWDVPVMAIAENRAGNYKDEFGDDLQRSLNEDTLPLFEEAGYEIVDWASNNMDWSDVRDRAKKVSDPPTPDYQEGWVNGDMEIIDV